MLSLMRGMPYLTSSVESCMHTMCAPRCCGQQVGEPSRGLGFLHIARGLQVVEPSRGF